MAQRRFQDAVLELSMRLSGDDPTFILDMADATPEECEVVLGVLDELAAEEEAARIAGQLRAMGHVL